MAADIGDHATFTFEQIAAEGPPARPLDFPAPVVRRGVRVNALVVHPTTGQRDILPGVIHRASYTNGGGGGHDRLDSREEESSDDDDNDDDDDDDSGVGQEVVGPNSRNATGSERSHHSKSSKTSGRSDGGGTTSTTNPENSRKNNSTRSNKSLRKNTGGGGSTRSSRKSSSRRGVHKEPEYVAYFPQRRLQDAIYGSVWACLVLHRHYGPAADDAARAASVRPGDPNAPIVWEIVGRHVAIKMVEWSRVHQARGRLLEDPVKEIAAMQLIGTDHPHVLGSMEVLQDDEFLFSIMPYARGGDLFGYVVRDTELRGGEGGMSEPVARYWFRQLLEVRKTDFMEFLLTHGEMSLNLSFLSLPASKN